MKPLQIRYIRTTEKGTHIYGIRGVYTMSDFAYDVRKEIIHAIRNTQENEWAPIWGNAKVRYANPTHSTNLRDIRIEVVNDEAIQYTQDV